MIFGVTYNSKFPELVHQYPNGLAIYLLPCNSRSVACFGGPVGALEGMMEANGDHATFHHMTRIAMAMEEYKSRVDFFPKQGKEVDFDAQDPDIPGIYEFIESEKGTEKENKTDGKLLVPNSGYEVQSEYEKFIKSNDSGLQADFRCKPCKNCENCIKGSGSENMSIAQEAEQVLIEESVKIDVENGRAIANLPFKRDPREYLKDNYHIAFKRLQNICKKYSKEESVRSKILESFEKLRKKGHIKHYEDLNAEQISILENAEPSYHIPWDVQFKGNSLSTPLRIVKLPQDTV